MSIDLRLYIIFAERVVQKDGSFDKNGSLLKKFGHFGLSV